MTIRELVEQGKIPWVLKVPDHIDKVVVHDGTFHADDVFCVALLMECYKEDIKWKRVPRNAVLGKYGYDVLICDIGYEYDGVNKFDHHQYANARLAASELRAAIGLLWDAYGNDMYHRTTSMFRDIDRHDNNSRQFRSQLCVSIGMFNPDWNASDDERDRCFEMAVNVARQMIRASRISDTYNMRAIREISEHMEIVGDVMILDTNAPYEFCISDYDVKIVARKCGNKYKLKAVNGYNFDKRWSGAPPFKNMSMVSWIIETTDYDTIFKIAKLL